MSSLPSFFPFLFPSFLPSLLVFYGARMPWYCSGGYSSDLYSWGYCLRPHSRTSSFPGRGLTRASSALGCSAGNSYFASRTVVLTSHLVTKFLSLFLFIVVFNCSSHAVLFCIRVRCTASWLNSRTLYNMVLPPIFPVCTWHHPHLVTLPPAPHFISPGLLTL